MKRSSRRFWTCCLAFVACTLNIASNSSKQKRMVIVNPNTDLKLGFLWNAPIAIILPTLTREFIPGKNEGFAEEEEGTTGDNAEGNVEGRSLGNSFSQEKAPQDLYVDQGYGRQVDYLMTYFALLEVRSLSCQERLICELASDTQTFFPVSEFILRELKQSHGKVTQSRNSLMWRYMNAAREGIDIGLQNSCDKAYKKCPVPAIKMLNMPVLKVWQYISSKLNLNIV